MITLRCIKINVNIFAGNMISGLVHSPVYVSEVNLKTERESQNLMNISPSDFTHWAPVLAPPHTRIETVLFFFRESEAISDNQQSISASLTESNSIVKLATCPP